MNHDLHLLREFYTDLNISKYIIYCILNISDLHSMCIFSYYQDALLYWENIFQNRNLNTVVLFKQFFFISNKGYTQKLYFILKVTVHFPEGQFPERTSSRKPWAELSCGPNFSGKHPLGKMTFGIMSDIDTKSECLFLENCIFGLKFCLFRPSF